MAELLLVGVVAGFLAGISPCILPVLPVILVGGARPDRTAEPGARAAAVPAAVAAAATGGGTSVLTGAPAGQTAAGPVPPGPGSGARGRSQPGRPLALIAGLIVSFSLIVLVGSELLSLLHLPQDTLRDIGIVLLIAVGLGYLVPPFGALLERPFARVSAPRPGGRGRAGGFVLGLALGVLYIPCAGPVLAALTVVGATHRVGLTAVLLTAAFAVGTAVPLLAIALAGQQLAARLSALRRHAPLVRRAGGVVLIVMAVVIATNVLAGVQRDVPGYSTALQGSAAIRRELNGVTGVKQTKITSCSPTATALQNCGPAPAFAGITTWLNTPGGRPLTMAGLRGKVVLVDFWTYSCINCQRSLPHVEAWYSRYAKDGLVVVGVHTPEFAFEHVVSNVRAQSKALGVRYPVAIDNSYATWNAYDNEYWPAEYLIDAQGNVRHVSFGEGGYSTTEKLIRQLLTAARPQQALPPPTTVPNLTPTGELSPETYLGYTRIQYLDPADSLRPNAAHDYAFPSSLPLGAMAWSGTWTDHAEETTAGQDARIELGFLAADVYLVLGGHGTIGVSLGGKPLKTITVAGIPRLYTLYHAAAETEGTLRLTVSPGVQAYDFTFG